MRILIHVLAWILIWLWMSTVYLYNVSDMPSFLLSNLTRMPVFILATYAVTQIVVLRNLVQTPPKYLNATIQFIAIFITAVLLDRLILGLDFAEPTLEGEPLLYTFINPIAIFKNAFILLSILGLAASLQFFTHTLKQEKVIHLLKEEKLESELSFLRSQINPHFLFNIFNNLYSLASRNGQNDLAKGLAGMAGLMRYLTYESNVPAVSLDKEVELLQSFIELQRLRIGDSEEVLINFKTEGKFSKYYIAPVLLLPLVENAFKHSISPGHPTIIDIVLQTENDNLHFEVRNKKTTTANSDKNGIGLQNLKKRLELIYPQQHQFVIQEDLNFFKVYLRINLNSVIQTKLTPVV